MLCFSREKNQVILYTILLACVCILHVGFPLFCFHSLSQKGNTATYKSSGACQSRKMYECIGVESSAVERTRGGGGGGGWDVLYTTNIERKLHHMDSYRTVTKFAFYFLPIRWKQLLRGIDAL